MSSNTKRKHKTLTLREKMDIIQRLENRESATHLAKEYGVGRGTMYDIKKRKVEITEHFEKIDNVEMKRKTLKRGDYPEMESALFKWFLKARAKQEFISGEILKAKAREFYKKIMKNDEFKASDGWFDKFKKRYSIRLYSNTFSNSIYAVQDLLQDEISKLGLTADQVYNAKESGLFWQMLPTNTSAISEVNNEPNDRKEIITLMPCANASGTHKFDLMVIGQAEYSGALKNDRLPVYYKNQYNAAITRELLTQWFYVEFVPKVKEFMRKSNLPEKALLLLYNTSGNLSADDLKSSDGHIRTMILPTNCSHSLQPMSNIIYMIKSRYKKKLLLDVIAQDGDIGQILREVKTDNIVFAIAKSWDSISASNIRSSWEKLWPSMIENEDGKVKKEEKTDDDKQEDDDVDLPIATWLKILAKKNLKINHKQLTAWFQVNDEETDKLMAEEQICADNLLEVVIKEEGVKKPSPSKTSVSSNDALQCFSKCITWAEENDASGEEIMVLKNLHEKALKQALVDKMCVKD